MKMTQIENSRSPLAAKLLGGSALAVLALMSATNAAAQGNAPAAAAVEEIVVTGTSIRGVAPVGANVVSVGREEIKATGAQTVQQLLASVPQVTGFNNQAQGGFGSADGSGTNAPTIHSLGASASNGTLVLIDGHRLPLSGLNHTLADPSVIAPSALERVEVLPEGSSAVYGSDAVAGVLNFITRRRFDGLETSAQVGIGDEYHTANFNLVWGSIWDTGSALFSYGYSYQSAYQNEDRKWWKTDLRSLGGSNFNSFTCTPASVQAGASGGANAFFLAPYTGAAIAQSNVQGGTGVCQYGGDDDTVPEVVRHSALGKFEQKLGDRLTLSVDLVYSQRQQKEQGGAGNVTNAVVWGPGSTPPGGAGQINPFFRGPTGTTVERVNFSFDQLLPPSVTKAGAETKFITVGAEYEVGGDWIAELGGTFGQDDSYQRQLGVLCSSCALFALNGTNQSGGSVTTNSQVPVLGTAVIATRLPLTTANALDVWSETGANRTSAAVLENLRENRFQLSRQNIENVKFTLGGSAFELPAGAVRVSMGAEGIRYSLRQFNTQSANLGNTNQNARFTNLDYSRDVYAFFGETIVPVIADMGPIERLNLSGAIRYDHYSDFGSTTNPKIAATMDMVGGLSFRGGWGTSFTAPALTSRGNERGITGESSVNTLGTQTLPGSVPGANTLPGCTTVTASTFCQIGGSNPTQGIQVNGGNAALRPSEGESWSVGVDWRPEFFRGFEAHITYWDVIANGLVTAPNFSQVVASSALREQALIINPTQAQIANAIAGLPQNAVLPANIQVIYSFQQRNVSNLKAAGIDFDFRYRTATDIGDFVFSLAGSEKVKFEQQAGVGTPFLSRLNTAGLNTTFSSLRRTGRFAVSWSNGPWRAGGSANYTHPYWLRSTTAVADFGPRGQRVKKFVTVDANLSYEFESESGFTNGMELFLNARNLFNQAPPFADQNGGFSTQDASGLGRVVTVGIRKEW